MYSTIPVINVVKSIIGFMASTMSYMFVHYMQSIIYTTYNSLEATEQQNAHFKDTLVSMKSCFAYSMNDLPGYNGPIGPLTLPFLVETDIVKGSR
jgi:hypothetical protein